MDAEAVGINVGQRPQVVDAAELVAHLFVAQVTECGALEGEAAVARTTIVHDEDHVALLCHIEFPGTCAPKPAFLHVANARAAINVNHGGILLCGVEVERLYEAIVEVRRAVGGFQRTVFNGGCFVAVAPLVFHVLQHGWCGFPCRGAQADGAEGAGL